MDFLRVSAGATLTVEIPRSADAKIVGATGANSIASVDLGIVSNTTATSAPPFGMRIWSSSAYRYRITSQNLGRLVHDDGNTDIGFSMEVAGRPVDLANGSTFEASSHTGPMGDFYDLDIEVPATNAKAGNYRDRITVTVVAI